ncbi:NfeD family protein [Tautonia plasticadhaerens]|uniref:NfeD-like C-terminal domain-containing protein n=1 Tax=Tautonia plasticadhaerens TaxID=2527974 RepID=A0A518HB18_9BACT|nr:NfeD family protein [Tautonia plasticadhaerens]QDV38052.1 hypothetical protein ElP_60000 [Tautonia plasticadhaerens]
MRRPQVSPGTPARSATPLRPSGKVSIEGRTFDARAAGSWIDADQPVSVHRVDGFGLVVGPPGTSPLPRDDGPSGLDGSDPDSYRPPSRLERHLSGLIAFGALGTGGAGLLLLALAFRVGPRDLLYLLAPVLVGGAASGAALYGLACLAIGLLGRASRLLGRPGPVGLLARVLASPLEVLLVLTMLAIAAAGLLLVAGSGADPP